MSVMSLGKNEQFEQFDPEVLLLAETEANEGDKDFSGDCYGSSDKDRNGLAPEMTLVIRKPESC